MSKVEKIIIEGNKEHNMGLDGLDFYTGKIQAMIEKGEVSIDSLTVYVTAIKLAARRCKESFEWVFTSLKRLDGEN